MHSIPIIILSGLMALFWCGVAVGLFRSDQPGGGAIALVAALVLPVGCFAYFRNASLWVDGEEVGAVNLLGIARKCRVNELASVEYRYSPQPTLNFIRKDGHRAFRVNARLWTKEQLHALREGLPPDLR